MLLHSLGRTVVLMLGCFSSGTLVAERLVLTDLKLIDGSGEQLRPVGTLVVDDGIIVAIDDAGDVGASGERNRETRIDLGGAWVMPGLIDTHVHVARFPDTHAQATSILERAVRGGVTSVRDLGGDVRTLAEIERAAHRRELIAPTLAYAGMYGGPAIFAKPPISQMGGGRRSGTTPWTRAVTDDLDLPLAIAETKGAGASGIKLYGNLDAAQVAGIIGEAHRQGLRAWAHATVFPAGPGELVAAGVDSLSHAPYLVWAAAGHIPDDFAARIAGPWNDVPPDHPKLLALYRSMAERGISLDATLYVFDRMQNFSPEVKADWAPSAFAWAVRATAEAHRQGVPITTGTDWFEPSTGELPHTHDELLLLVDKVGMTPMQAIVAGTRNGAAALGLLQRRGTIEVGKAADLLVLRANPLEDIRNTKSLLYVVKDGVVIAP